MVLLIIMIALIVVFAVIAIIGLRAHLNTPVGTETFDPEVFQGNRVRRGK